MTLIYILIATFLISLISFIGVFTLIVKKEFLDKALLFLVAFSAGTLIGGAFLHLLPEAIEETGETSKVFLFVLLGFSCFFVLEQIIRWHHHHDTCCSKIAPFSYMILVSDGIHNLIDGFVIAASFMVSVPIGIITTLAIAFHEIPQEIGDFGVLIFGGMNKWKALFLNLTSALAAVIGGIMGFFLSEKIGEATIFLLPFAAGNFIYIASSDLIPEINHHNDSKKSIFYFLVFLLGIGFIFLLGFLE
jgi:zinc and cadmium transporter